MASTLNTEDTCRLPRDRRKLTCIFSSTAAYFSYRRRLTVVMFFFSCQMLHYCHICCGYPNYRDSFPKDKLVDQLFSFVRLSSLTAVLHSIPCVVMIDALLACCCWTIFPVLIMVWTIQVEACEKNLRTFIYEYI